MHTLFNMEIVSRQGILKPPQWNYVREGFKDNLSKVITYYRKNPQAVKSDHFLVKLLQSITVSQSLDTVRYYNAVDAMALNMSMALKMTSSIYPGKVFNGIFYGLGNDEILIATDMGFDPLYAHDHWRDVCAVQVLRHPRSDLYLTLADGKSTGREQGVVVVTVNIPLLAIQYRAFRMNERLATLDSQQSVMQFVHMYVLPNMLPGHLDYAIFNRLFMRLLFKEPGINERKLPFFLTDYSQRADDVLKEVLNTVSTHAYRFDTIMRSIPSVTASEGIETFKLPELAPTRQVLWSLVVSRLPILEFLFRIYDRVRSSQNSGEINKVLRAALFYRNDGTLRDNLPLDLYYDAMETVDLLEEIGKQ